MPSEDAGMVLEILRFSLHDGPGIRTTVFLKGCPLSCEWCHNPESKSYKPQLSFDSSRCTNCMECLPACSTGALSQTGERLTVSFDLCNACGDCVQACSSDALKVYGGVRTVDDIMSVVLKDLPFYKRSGGGLTISGGEPMAQLEFTLGLLKAARRHGIHTCIETSGHAPTGYFARLLGYVDLFLYDFKETDAAAHKRVTGVSNRLILENLEFLYSERANIILRCPIIPGSNDTARHFAGIYALQTKYPELLGIELMPYHNMGKGKAEHVGADYALKDIATSSQDQIAGWIKMLSEIGCEEVRTG